MVEAYTVVTSRHEAGSARQRDEAEWQEINFVSVVGKILRKRGHRFADSNGRPDGACIVSKTSASSAYQADRGLEIADLACRVAPATSRGCTSSYLCLFLMAGLVESHSFAAIAQSRHRVACQIGTLRDAVAPTSTA